MQYLWFFSRVWSFVLLMVTESLSKPVRPSRKTKAKTTRTGPGGSLIPSFWKEHAIVTAALKQIYSTTLNGAWWVTKFTELVDFNFSLRHPAVKLKMALRSLNSIKLRIELKQFLRFFASRHFHIMPSKIPFNYLAENR